jgi:hypothetical protein
MELSRRDALAALSSLGTAGTAGCLAEAPHNGEPAEFGMDSSSQDTDRIVDVYVAVAEVVYPSEVTGIEEFVESFVRPRVDRPDHGPAMAQAVTELAQRAEMWYDGTDITSLSREDRETLLAGMGVKTAEEDPGGRLAERVRFYVVNELLLALYSSPTGGELVGIENPQGHPGGTETYQRGPGQ